MFGDCSGKVVIDGFSGDTAQRSESVNVATCESPEALTVRELDVEHAAVRIDQREGIQFALVTGIIKRAEVSPVYFKAFAGERLHSHESALGRGLWANFLHILPQNAVSAGIAERAEALLDDCGGDERIFLQPFGDIALERISLLKRARLAGPCAGASRYFLMVCQPMLRWRSILRIGQCSDQ